MDEAGALPMTAEEVAHQSQDEERSRRRSRQGTSAKPLAEGRDDVGGKHVALGKAVGKKSEEAGAMLGVKVAGSYQPVQRGVELRILQPMVHHEDEKGVQSKEGGDSAHIRS